MLFAHYSAMQQTYKHTRYVEERPATCTASIKYGTRAMR